MVAKRHKVTHEEFMLIQKLKNQQEETMKIQRKFDQLTGIDRNKIQIKCKDRDIAFKVKQINSGKVLEVHAEYVNNLKPIHILHNEMDVIVQEKTELEELNKSIQSIMEKEAEEDKKQDG